MGRCVGCVEVVSGSSGAHVTRDKLLIRFMYHVATGRNLTGCSDDVDDDVEYELTPLEHALNALHSLEPLCTDSVSQLTCTLTQLIKHQVIARISPP